MRMILKNPVAQTLLESLRTRLARVLKDVPKLAKANEGERNAVLGLSGMV